MMTIRRGLAFVCDCMALGCALGALLGRWCAGRLRGDDPREWRRGQV